MKIGFIGTGTMGQPMVANLVKKGHAVVGLRRRAEPALDAAVKLGAARGRARRPTPRKQSELVITMLPSSSHVEAAYLGAGGVLEGVGAGRLCIDMSTIDPERVAPGRGGACAERGAALPRRAGVGRRPARGGRHAGHHGRRRRRATSRRRARRWRRWAPTSSTWAPVGIGRGRQALQQPDRRRGRGRGQRGVPDRRGLRRRPQGPDRRHRQVVGQHLGDGAHASRARPRGARRPPAATTRRAS